MFDNWNFARPEYFNQAVMLTVTELENDVIKKAVEKLVIHHDVLRGVYRQKELEILPVSESKLFDSYEFDYSAEKENTAQLIEKQCEEIQGSMDLENGPLVKIAIFKLSGSKVMMFCIHHMLVDGVSWHILTEDFKTAAEQISKGEEVVLPEKTASFIEWSRTLKEYGERMTAKERNYWKAAAAEVQSGLISIPDTNAEDTMSVNSVNIEFDAETTGSLLEKMQEKINTYPGETQSQKIEYFLVNDAGVSRENISKIKELLLEEAQ